MFALIQASRYSFSGSAKWAAYAPRRISLTLSANRSQPSWRPSFAGECMSRNRAVLFSTLILALACSCNTVSDDTIATDIKAKMFSEPLLKSAAVNIVTKNGIVTITGIVPDDSARLAAERIASQTKGVKQVIDSTTVAQAAAQTAAAAAPAAPPAPVPPAAPRQTRKREKRSLETAPSRPDDANEAATPVPDNNPAPPQQPAAPVVASNPVLPDAPGPITPPPPPPPQPITVTIPDGTVVNIRTIDAIDSSTASAGQSFRGSLDAPVVVNDQVVLPKGLNARLKIVEAESAGKFKGSSELTVSLDTITYQGKTYTFASSDVQQKGASRGKRSAEVIGGGAVLGALIGGLAGGGKGAAIGAGVGAGSGTAVQALTHGQKVKIPSETKLDFTLHAPIDVTFFSNKSRINPPPPPSPDQPNTPPTQQ
jgi:hypothetical protein